MGLFDEYSGEIHEERELAIKSNLHDTRMQHVHEVYKAWHTDRTLRNTRHYRYWYQKACEQLEPMTMHEVTAFYEEICTSPSPQHDTGEFLTALVQRAYDNGYNDFNFAVHRSPAFYVLGANLTAQPDNPLRMTLTGEVGSAFGHTSNVHVQIYGDVRGLFASSTRSSRFTINGNVHTSMGHDARNSYFEVHGCMYKHSFSQVHKCTIVLHDKYQDEVCFGAHDTMIYLHKAGSGKVSQYGSRNCVFAADSNILKDVKRSASKLTRLYLLDEDGQKPYGALTKIREWFK